MFAQSMRISPLIAAISLALLAAQAQANDPQPTPKKYVPLFNRMFGSDPSDPSNTTDPDPVAPSKPQTSANAQVTPSNNSAVPSSAVTSAATSIPASTATGSSVASATAARTSTEDLGTSTPSTTTRTAKPKKVKTTQSNTPTNVAGVAAASSVVAANTVTATSDSSVASHVSNSTSLNVQELPEVTVVGNTPIGTQGLAEYKIAGIGKFLADCDKGPAVNVISCSSASTIDSESICTRLRGALNQQAKLNKKSTGKITGYTKSCGVDETGKVFLCVTPKEERQCSWWAQIPIIGMILLALMSFLDFFIGRSTNKGTEKYNSLKANADEHVLTDNNCV